MEPVVHTCNPSYLGGRDQEDHISKPIQANSCETLSGTKPTLTRSGRVAQRVECLSSNPSTTKKRKKKKKHSLGSVAL
jgi:hypothetical protein